MSGGAWFVHGATAPGDRDCGSCFWNASPLPPTCPLWHRHRLLRGQQSIRRYRFGLLAHQCAFKEEAPTELEEDLSPRGRVATHPRRSPSPPQASLPSSPSPLRPHPTTPPWSYMGQTLPPRPPHSHQATLLPLLPTFSSFHLAKPCTSFSAQPQCRLPTKPPGHVCHYLPSVPAVLCSLSPNAFNWELLKGRRRVSVSPPLRLVFMNHL